MILDTAERAVMREMQMRGEASLQHDTLEGLVQLGSTQVFDQTIAQLRSKGLVVVTRFSPRVEPEISLTIAGRSIKIDGDELPPPPPPPVTSTVTDQQIVSAPTTLFGGPTMQEVFNVHAADH